MTAAMEQADHSTTLPARLDQMARLGALVRGWVARCAPSDQELASRLELATHEIATNIVRHAYAGTPGIIEVELSCSPTELLVTMRDHGRPFDASGVSAPEPETPRVGGYGLYLADRLVDEVRYERRSNTYDWRRLCRLSTPTRQES